MPANHSDHFPPMGRLFPHEISCKTCREMAICNYCGQPDSAPKDKRCTNGRCPRCCHAHCEHRTP